MIHIGCHLSVAQGYAAMGQTALSIGADTFQFFTRNPRGGATKAVDPDDRAKLLDLMNEHHFPCILAHAPYTLNPCSANERTRDFAREIMIDDLKRMEYLPKQFYNFHPGSHTGQGIETGIRQITDMLNAVLREDQTTTVLIETMAGKGTEIGSRFEELRDILKGVELTDKMGVCLDTCHVSDAGYDIIHNIDGVLDEFDSIIGLSRLKAIHLNDSKNPPGSRKDRHERIGMGYIGLDALSEIVKHPALSRLPFYLETPNDPAGHGEEIALIKSRCS